MAARLEVREVGMMRTHYLGRSVVLDSVLDVAGVEHFRIENEGRGVTEVAQEMLVMAGWTTAR